MNYSCGNGQNKIAPHQGHSRPPPVNGDEKYANDSQYLSEAQEELASFVPLKLRTRQKSFAPIIWAQLILSSPSSWGKLNYAFLFCRINLHYVNRVRTLENWRDMLMTENDRRLRGLSRENYGHPQSLQRQRHKSEARVWNISYFPSIHSAVIIQITFGDFHIHVIVQLLYTLIVNWEIHRRTWHRRILSIHFINIIQSLFNVLYWFQMKEE